MAIFLYKKCQQNIKPLSTGTTNLTVESAFHGIELFEICKTSPFGRNPTLELVVVVVLIPLVRPELQGLERQRKVLG